MMSARRQKELDRFQPVDLRAGVVAHQQRRLPFVRDVEPEVGMNRPKHEHRQRPANQAEAHARGPARPQPLGQHRPGQQLQVKKEIVGIARAQRRRGAIAEPAPDRARRRPAANRDHSAGEEGQRHRVGERQPEVRQAPAQTEKGKREQERTAERPFPPVTQKARA